MVGRPGGERTALAFVATGNDTAQAALKQLSHRFGNMPPALADVIVALGGDGFMLETLHAYLELGKPDLWHEPRHVGFLLNAIRRRRSARRGWRARNVGRSASAAHDAATSVDGTVDGGAGDQ